MNERKKGDGEFLSDPVCLSSGPVQLKVRVQKARLLFALMMDLDFSTGFIYSFYPLVYLQILFSGFIHWFYPLVLYTAFIHWFYTLVSSTGCCCLFFCFSPSFSLTLKNCYIHK